MRKISRKNRIILKPFVFLQKNGGGDMKVYQDSKGNINGYSWNISNKFIYNPQNEMLAFCKTKCSIRKTKRIFSIIPS